MRSHESPFLSFGKAPFALFVVALASGAFLLNQAGDKGKVVPPDLVFAVFSKEHKADYERTIPAFEKEHGVKVKLMQLDARSLTSRLQASLSAGAPTPDLFEIVEPNIGVFTRGPLEDVGLLDLTERVEKENLKEKMVAARFDLWSSRRRIFALPHDVHPVALAYRRDLVEETGIDVNSLATWDAFLEAGKRATRDLDGDGVADRYMLDLESSGGNTLGALLVQGDGGFFDRDGRIILDTPHARRVVEWYVRASRGKDRISVPLGWGQTFAKGLVDGRVLFVMMPDWRSRVVVNDVPGVAGKMALMPLPAWTKGGRRTTTMGGTGLAIAKNSKNVELAWKLARALYLTPASYGERYKNSFIVPPLPEAWKLPEMAAPVAFWSDIPLGTFYSKLALDVPSVAVTSYEQMVRAKFSEVMISSGLRYEAGETDLARVIDEEMVTAIEYIRKITSRNRFLNAEKK